MIQKILEEVIPMDLSWETNPAWADGGKTDSWFSDKELILIEKDLLFLLLEDNSQKFK